MARGEWVETSVGFGGTKEEVLSEVTKGFQRKDGAEAWSRLKSIPIG